jgi:hypothetical protein
VTIGGRFREAVSQAVPPSREALSPADLLDGVERFVRSYVAFRNTHQSAAVALHIAHAHAIAAAETTLYVQFSSATKRSGKTRALECIELLVPNPLRVASVSEAVLFRTISEGTTILLDEVDAIFRPKNEREELRSLLNAGYRRGARVARCETVKNKIEVRQYEAFGPKVLAGIGNLPDTIADRCIKIVLNRRAPGEAVRRFRYREALAEALPLRGRLEMWAARAVELLRDARPDVPEALNDRAADGWEPFLAIADMAGGEWPKRAREAALALHGEGQPTEEALGVQLLADIRAVFEARGTKRLTPAEIVEALMEIGEGPWPVWWSRQVRDGDVRGPGRRLRNLLHDFDVPESRDLRTDEGTRKGYQAEDFRDAWTRYLPPSPQEPEKQRDNATPQVNGQIRGSEAKSPESPKTAPDQGRSVVASQRRDIGEEPVEEPVDGPLELAAQRVLSAFPGTEVLPEDPVDYARVRYEGGERDLFALARELRVLGHTKPDGGRWLAADVALALGLAI